MPHNRPVDVLLVDDNAIQAATREMILLRAGFGVLVAHKALDALKMLGRLEVGGAVRVVVTDHLMPEMNGPDFVRALRKTFPDLPVLVLSGLPGAEAEYEGLQVSFRLKPFSPEKLIGVVKELVDDSLIRSSA